MTKPTPASHSRRASSSLPGDVRGAILILDALVFAADVEHLAGPAQDQIEGLGFEAVHRLGDAGAVDVAIEGVEGPQQVAAIVQTLAMLICRFMLLRALPAASNGE